MTTEFELEPEVGFFFIKFAGVLVVLVVGVLVAGDPVMSAVLR